MRAPPCAWPVGCAATVPRNRFVAVDLSWNVGIRLAESYEARPAPSFPFGIGFWDQDAVVNVNAALVASGYSGPVPVLSLAEAHLAYYDIAAEGTYVTTEAPLGTQSLVIDGGTFGMQPARLRPLQAGAGVFF